MAILTVSNIPTAGATYTTIAAAIAAAVNGDTIEIRGGTYGSFTCPSGKKLIYRFLHGAKVRGSGSGTGITVGSTVGNQYIADFYGLDISGFANQISDATNSIDPVAKFYDCRFQGAMFNLNFNYNFEYTRCSFISVNFRNGRTPINEQCIGGATYCTFVNCTQLGTYAKRANQTLGFNNNIIHNSSFWIFRDLDNNNFKGYRENSWVRNIISGDCTFKSIPDEGFTRPQFDALPYVSVAGVADMQAKITADALALSRSNWTLTTTDFTFKTIALNAYNFGTSEANYIRMRHAGFGRFAQTALAANFVANPDFTLTSDYITRNTTDDATAQAILTFPQARKIRRLELHFSGTTSGAEYFGGSVNGSIPLSVEASLDGVNYLAPITLYSGLIDTGGGVYNFDLPAALYAKRLRVSVTLTGATAGLVRINGISAEANSFEDIIPQTAGRLAINQLGTGSGNLINANYGCFIPQPLRKYFTNTMKDKYTATELIAEALANPDIALLYEDVAETNITAIKVSTPTGDKFIYTFNEL